MKPAGASVNGIFADVLLPILVCKTEMVSGLVLV